MATTSSVEIYVYGSGPINVTIKTNTYSTNFAITRKQATELANLLYRQNVLDMVSFTSAQHEEFAISWTPRVPSPNYSLRFIFKGIKEILPNVLTITEESAQVLLRKLNTVLSGDTEKEFLPDSKECLDCHGKKRILLLNSYVPCDCVKGK